MHLIIWRHPKPRNAQGICLGHTDLQVDTRKAKRLANQIERFANRNGLPKQIWVSPLQRAKIVGQILVQRGWICHISSALIEMNFGAWDGKAWQDIAIADIDAWCANFADYHFATGESLKQLFHRVQAWTHEQYGVINGVNNPPILAVGHAGWINVAKMIADNQAVPTDPSKWAKPVNYAQRTELLFV